MSTNTYRICLLPGDGIGPEIMAEAEKVLAAIAKKYDTVFETSSHLIGGAAIDATRAAGLPLTAFPAETLEAARAADAVLLAAVGGPKWDDPAPGEPRPEQGLFGIRKELGLYLNLRPVRTWSALRDASPLRPERLEGVDLLIVRELTGGLYFGTHERRPAALAAQAAQAPDATAADAPADVVADAPAAAVVAEAPAAAESDDLLSQFAVDTMEYTGYEIERVVRWAFEAARRRNVKRVHSVDKANVLETSRLWRDVAHRVAADYPDVESSDMLVDNCAMQLMAAPAQFSVLVTENTFGDILSDEASMLAGSLGMLASASMGTGTPLFEPCHGTAPDIAGQGIANPLAMILSVELMLRHALDMPQAADDVASAVETVLDQGWRTRDIADASTPAERILGTAAMGDAVVAALG